MYCNKNHGKSQKTHCYKLEKLKNHKLIILTTLLILISRNLRNCHELFPVRI